jgi:hypothetical protein
MIGGLKVPEKGVVVHFYCVKVDVLDAASQPTRKIIQLRLVVPYSKPGDRRLAQMQQEVARQQISAELGKFSTNGVNSL